MEPPAPPLQPWLFQVQPYAEESFGHFLGRFRRANHLSCGHLAAMLGQQAYIVAYWESPSRRRRPSVDQLKQLARFSGVEVSRLRLMWSPPGTALHWPTRCCSQCYAEAPWHKLTWQIADQPDCPVHRRPLLSACPDCQSAFQLPSYWVTGACQCCLRSFGDMKPDPAVNGKA